MVGIEPTITLSANYPRLRLEGKMFSLVLIGAPQELNIPYFAMPLPSSKESSWYYPGRKATPLSDLLGGNTYRWVVDKQKKHGIKRICTRNYIPIKTAFYANWLVFNDDVLAQEFLTRFPQFVTDSSIKKLKSDLDELVGKVDIKLKRGAYDLSKYPFDQRRYAAQRFIDFDDQVRSLTERIRYLETASKLADEWSSIIERELVWTMDS